MKLLISPQDLEEAREAVAGGADIIDVKNPREGSLGANFPWVIKEIVDMVPEGMETSATLGDLPQKPGTASLAARGLASLDVDYIKGGLLGSRNRDEALEMAENIARSVEGFDVKLVLAGYADYNEAGTISPLELPDIAHQAGAFGVMIDTLSKNGSGLMDHMGEVDLGTFIEKTHDLGLEAALAGSLKEDDLKVLQGMGADIVGVRGLVCEEGDRMNGRVDREKVRDLKKGL